MCKLFHRKTVFYRDTKTVDTQRASLLETLLLTAGDIGNITALFSRQCSTVEFLLEDALD